MRIPHDLLKLAIGLALCILRALTELPDEDKAETQHHTRRQPQEELPNPAAWIRQRWELGLIDHSDDGSIPNLIDPSLFVSLGHRGHEFLPHDHLTL